MAAGSPLRPTVAAVFAAALAATLALSACGRGGERPPQPGDQVAARVDGQPVWTSDVRREAEAQALVAKGQPLDPASEVFRNTLDQLVDRKLLAAEAARRGLDRDPMTQRRLAAARERVLGDRLVEGAIADAVTESAVQNLYKEQVKLQKRTEQIHARQIVTAKPADAQAVKKLLAAGAAFDPLALERSIDTATRFNGGDLGWFALDVMPEGYAQALATAKPGQLVGPFETNGRWAVVKVEDRRQEPPITLAAARPQIERFLTYDRIRDLLDKLRKRAHVELVKPAASPVLSPPPQGAAS
jgi:peptidyl-prolyl cis-trans isomerase C